jgi:hypothetical protein
MPAQAQLEKEYFETNEGIAHLLFDLRPMRQRAFELEKTIFYDRGALLPFTEPRTVNGGSPCAMVEISMQKAELAEMLHQARVYVGPAATRVLQDEVGQGTMICSTFEEGIAD